MTNSTALAHAAFNDNEECAKVLVELGCDVDALDNEGQTIRCDMNIYNGPNVFLEAGADPTSQIPTVVHHSTTLPRVARSPWCVHFLSMEPKTHAVNNDSK